MRRRGGPSMPRHSQGGHREREDRKNRNRRGASCFAVLFAFTVLTLGFFFVLHKKRFEASMASRQPPPKPVERHWDLPRTLHDLYGAKDDLLSGTPSDIWVLVDVNLDTSVTREVQVSLCKLTGKVLEAHAKNPSELPMFKDLIAKHCTKSSLRTVGLDYAVRAKEKEAEKEGRSLQDPAGFVFHESRVGSTLVANMFASVPRFLVWTESKAPASVLLHCVLCSKEKQIEVLRKVMRFMCYSPFHSACFFKFQSATVPSMATLIEAFPKTPYVFLFRNPVQTLMSHMKSRKAGRGAPCLRSRQNPPPEVVRIFTSATGRSIKQATAPEYCAAHLAYLSASAERVLRKSNASSQQGSAQLGIAVEYRSLPDEFVQSVVTGHFGVAIGPTVKSRMLKESEEYSKARSSPVAWHDDSKNKEDAADLQELEAAKTILQPSYDKLLELATQDMLLVQHRVAAMKKPLQASPQMYSAEANVANNHSWKKAAPPADWRAPADWSGEKVPVDFRENDGTQPPWALFERGAISTTGDSSPFDATNCPGIPPEDYPKHYPILNVTSNWPPDDTRVPVNHFGTLCRFDYETELDKCFAYRDAEKPFVVYNVPPVEETVAKWSDLRYLSERLGNRRYRTEHSQNNHFMYWGNVRSPGKAPRSPRYQNMDGSMWEPPTDIRRLSFEDFMHYALEGENVDKHLDSEHFYFRVGDVDAPFIREEDLTIFNGEKNLFMKDPKGQRGIHCRFGMRSVIAESHYDSTRNFVVQVGGARRWIMSRPEECKHMHLLPMTHPSGRHSAVDWSNPDLEKFPKYHRLNVFDVILQAGEVLYVPAYWFHYIVSLGVNYQCNSRSGKSKTGAKAIQECGFAV